MTRINCGIPPEELTDKHLIAEHREITRIPNAIRSGRFNLFGQPDEFTLNEGHVKFFYDKLRYLEKRYTSLYLECIKRDFNVTYKGDAFGNIPKKYMGDYEPTDRDRQIVRERIALRLKEYEEKVAQKKNIL